MNKKGYGYYMKLTDIFIFVAAAFMLILLANTLFPNLGKSGVYNVVEVPINQSAVEVVENLQEDYDSCIGARNEFEMLYTDCWNKEYLISLYQSNERLNRLLTRFKWISIILLLLLTLFVVLFIGKLSGFKELKKAWGKHSEEYVCKLRKRK